MKSKAWYRKAITHFGLLLAALVVYLIADYFFDLPPTALVFDSETVQAKINGNEVEFRGEYFFQANHPCRRSYELAFPVSESFQDAPISDIHVSADEKPLEVRLARSGFIFQMPVTPGASTRLVISYRLHAPGKRAEYITRTARLWPSPLKKARFISPPEARSNYHKGEATEVEYTGKTLPKMNWTLDWSKP
ncbi:MAG: hypothetical protein NTX50_17655 [Candidatus Sumerlaeota bacterium]|nr:hypothetical protein [Candidatus Sumerlaeota bacterium]